MVFGPFQSHLLTLEPDTNDLKYQIYLGVSLGMKILENLTSLASIFCFVNLTNK